MEIKIYDWDQIEVEIIKFLVFIGKIYIVWYELVLVICKVEINEVIDCILFKGNDVGVEILY